MLLPEFGMEIDVAKKTNKKANKKTKRSIKRREWTREDERLLKKHSRERTPIAKLSKAFKRTPGALRQKAYAMGIGLGHQR
jgi:hypothetical protein